VYGFENILYFLFGMFAFGNTCLFIGFVMTIEEAKSKKRQRRKRKLKKKEKLIGKKIAVKDDRQIFDDDNIIIEET